jgi:hypothetical protein
MNDREHITLPRELVQEALEALKSVQDHRPNDETNNAITALRTALAAPEQGVLALDDEEFTRKDVTTLLLEVMDWTYVQATRERPMTDAEKKVIDDIRAHLAAPDEMEALRRDADCYKRLKSRAEIYDGHVCFGDVRLPAPIPDRSPFDEIDEAVLAGALTAPEETT